MSCKIPTSEEGVHIIVGMGIMGTRSQMTNPTVRKESIGIHFLGNGIARFDTPVEGW
jgi:hypothetical protein